MNLKDRLKVARQDAKLSQSALARACGVEPSAINHIESGRTKSLSGDLVAKMALTLSVNALWLASGEGLKTPVTAVSASAEQAAGESSGTGTVVAPLSHQGPVIAEVFRLMAQMSEVGQRIVLDKARDMLKEYPAKAKAKRA